MKAVLLKLSEHLSKGETFSFLIVDSEINLFPRFHRHDFCEIFWVTGGSARHRINDTQETLTQGDLRILHGTDAHQIIPLDNTRFSFCNLAFPLLWLVNLMERHKFRPSRLLHVPGVQPHAFSLHPSNQAVLGEESVRLFTGTRDSLALETFLCLLLRMLIQLPRAQNKKVPHWLMEACVRIEEPEFLERGVQGFVHACRHGHEHVSRSTRRYLDKRPIDIVNESRVRLARRLLSATSLPVTQVAFQCGFTGLAQFYHLFRQATGQTPHSFRKRLQLKI